MALCVRLLNRRHRTLTSRIEEWLFAFQLSELYESIDLTEAKNLTYISEMLEEARKGDWRKALAMALAGASMMAPLKAHAHSQEFMHGCDVGNAAAQVADPEKAAAQALSLTIILGLYFTILQAREYHEASFTIADRVYGSTFFVATGFHGAHVLIGSTFLSVCLGRTIAHQFSNSHHFGFEAAA